MYPLVGNTLLCICRNIKQKNFIKRASCQLLKSSEQRLPGCMRALKSESFSCSVVSDSLRPHGLYLSRLLCPWKSPGKTMGTVIKKESVHSYQLHIKIGSIQHLDSALREIVRNKAIWKKKLKLFSSLNSI